MRNVLVLNADYTPMRVVPWERAVEQILDGKVVSVATVAGKFVRSPSLILPWPAVVALRRYSQKRYKIKFNSRSVLARDAWTCAYCGIQPRRLDGRPDRDALSLDHVIPRAQSKEGRVYVSATRKWMALNCWENAVTACLPCNLRKADRTPAQANMPLRSFPRKPTPADVLRITLERFPLVPPEWEPFLPAGWVGEGDAVSSPLAPSAAVRPLHRRAAG